MTDDPDFRTTGPDDFPDVPPPEDEVHSAARSCSAILIIVVIVGLIACVMFGIALLD